MISIFEYLFIFRELNKYLTDKDKLNLISTNKFLNNKRTKFTYNKRFWVDKLYEKEWFYDRLTNVAAAGVPIKFGFPKSVTELYLDFEFPKDLSYLNLASQNIKMNLYLEFLFNQIIIPNSVKYLEFGNDFNKKLINKIPNSVETLIFGHSFDQNIENYIPDSVITLEFGDNFDQPIKDCIPNSVKYLRFGYGFNQEIINAIPKSIIDLCFGEDFNQNIDYLPDSIKYLYLDDNYERKVKKLPSSLEKLWSSKRFVEINQDIISTFADLKIEL